MSATLYVCPRAHCRGTLVGDPNERNALACLLCAHRFALMLGRLYELAARAPTVEDRASLRASPKGR